MSSTTKRRGSAGRTALTVLALVLLVAAVVLVGLRGGTPGSQGPQPTAHATPRMTERATSTPAKPSSGQPAQPTPPAASGTARVKPPGSTISVEVDRDWIAREATWAPGQLQAHFEKHGREGPWASEADFDASARETIRIGTLFTYVDRESNAERLGFYDHKSNRFASVSWDGRRITTQFKPDRGEVYVRRLARSTYR
jgi:hypothetical protein